LPAIMHAAIYQTSFSSQPFINNADIE